MSQDTQRFRLRINVGIRQLQEYPHRGSGNWQETGMNQGLDIDNRIDIGDADFMELAGILGRFHELAQRIKAERNG